MLVPILMDGAKKEINISEIKGNHIIHSIYLIDKKNSIIKNSIKFLSGLSRNNFDFKNNKNI